MHLPKFLHQHHHPTTPNANVSPTVQWITRLWIARLLLRMKIVRITVITSPLLEWKCAALLNSTIGWELDISRRIFSELSTFLVERDRNFSVIALLLVDCIMIQIVKSIDVASLWLVLRKFGKLSDFWRRKALKHDLTYENSWDLRWD